MNELIAIGSQQIGEGLIKTVNARDLHEFLESSQDFSTWMKKRIKQYDFVENRDFVCLHKKMEANNATLIDYHLTLDMAKELSMVERNTKGKEARQYFLECERAAKLSPAPIAIPTHAEALRLAADALDQNEKLKITISEQAPKVAALDRIANAEGLLCLRDAAKALNMPPKKFNDLLQFHKWIYRKLGGALVGYQNRVQQGYVDHKVHTVALRDGTERIKEQVFITSKGLAKLAHAFSVQKAS